MIALVNPLATAWRARIPLSILSIGASLEGHYPYIIVDGNIERDIFHLLPKLITEKHIRYVAFTVMPGPQLPQAIELSRLVKKKFPHVKIIWGGYFPTLHTNVVLGSEYVDYVIRDQGDYSFRNLIDTLEHGGSLSLVKGLSYKNGSLCHNERQELIDPNELPPLPYERVPVQRYIGRTYIGSRTVNYHSSVGCPFLCGFCAVAAVFKARWIGLAPERIVNDLAYFKREHGLTAVEFNDNNFFTSEKRVSEFSERIDSYDLTWWGEARPDTVMAYDDSTWRKMKHAGCKMIFFGAESSSQQVLNFMNKGGTQTPDTVLALVEKMKHVGIVPELSFVLGSPSPDVEGTIEQDIQYIRRIKEINPATEIILYVCSPVFFEDSELFHAAEQFGFRYPQSLDEWLEPQWARHDLRKNPVTPWLTPKMTRRIKNFEHVLHAVFPTRSDLKLKNHHLQLLKLLGFWRYKLSFYDAAYEVRLLQRLIRYRQPETEGF